MTTDTQWTLVQPRFRQPSQDLGSRSRIVGRRALGPALLVAGWWLVTTRGWVDASILPTPATVADTFSSLWLEEGFARHLGTSLARALVGAVFGVSVGLLLGLVAGLWRLADELYDTLIQMLRTVPFLALVPLLIVWFGIGEAPKLLLIALATAFPMYLNVHAGVRNVDRKVIEAMGTFGLRGPALIFRVVLPLALPSILTGLRFALGVSVLVLVAAEQINTTQGLGYLLNNAQAYQQVDVMLICIFIYSLLGLAADLIVRNLEKVLMPWRGHIATR